MHYMSVVNNEYALPLKLAQLRTGSVYIYNPSDTQFGHHLSQFIQDSGLNAKTLVVRGNFTVEEGNLLPNIMFIISFLIGSNLQN